MQVPNLTILKVFNYYFVHFNLFMNKIIIRQVFTPMQ